MGFSSSNSGFCRDIIPMMENHMDKDRENQMETWIIEWFVRIRVLEVYGVDVNVLWEICSRIPWAYHENTRETSFCNGPLGTRKLHELPLWVQGPKWGFRAQIPLIL